MPIIVGLIVAVLIGMQAQMSKGRTGVLWGFLTLALYIGIWVFANAAALSDLQLRMNPNRLLAVSLVAGTISLVVGFLVVLTLPRSARQPAPPVAPTPRAPGS